MDTMASSVRVGYNCGEHDYESPFAHHLRYRGQPLEYDGWGDDFLVDGYYPTAAEREARAEKRRTDAMLTPRELAEEAR